MNKYVTEVCHVCDGTKLEKKTFHGIALECYACNGTGLVPNEEGIAILELVRDYGKRYYALRRKETNADQPVLGF